MEMRFTRGFAFESHQVLFPPLGSHWRGTLRSWQYNRKKKRSLGHISATSFSPVVEVEIVTIETMTHTVLALDRFHMKKSGRSFKQPEAGPG